MIKRELSAEALHALIVGRVAGDQDPSTLVKMVVHKVRKRIAPIKIETIWGNGYALSREARDEICGAMIRHRQAEGLA